MRRYGRSGGWWVRLLVGLLVAMVVGADGPVRARVERVEITSREPFAGGRSFGKIGPYEKIRGRFFYAVDPRAAFNRAIRDIDLAPRDADGLIRFAGDFLLIRPRDPARGNHVLLFDVTNRGNLTALGIFNSERSGNDPRSAGNGWLMREGYTLLAAAWNWDVPP
ncbi:MAG: hypothetical protein D6740_03165, partial [Alphaproteobacteria bacterium]